MIELVFATNNKHKLQEADQIIGEEVLILNLSDIDGEEDIDETADTLEGNALIKARFIASRHNVSCFADDTGLEVEALNGAPGVRSARYAGEPANAVENMKKLLDELEGETRRQARFRTVIALILEGQEYLFEGIIEGHILEEQRGEKGFGYDPVFVPLGETRTFAEMSASEKNKLSHRGKALEKMYHFLQSKTLR